MLRIRWHGHSCFEITNEITLVTDPHDGKSIGIHAPDVLGDIILVSHDHYDHNSVESVEKEESIVVKDGRIKTVLGVKIRGVGSFHDESAGRKRGKNIIYVFTMDNISFCHLGDLGHELDGDTVRQIGDVDVLFTPVGGNFTIDAEKAWNVINGIKPKIVIPMHYKIPNLTIKLQRVDAFLKEIGVEKQAVDHLPIKKKDLSNEEMRVIVMKIV